MFRFHADHYSAGFVDVLDLERRDDRDPGKSLVQYLALLDRRFYDRQFFLGAPFRVDESLGECRTHATATNNDQFERHGRTLQGCHVGRRRR